MNRCVLALHLYLRTATVGARARRNPDGRNPDGRNSDGMNSDGRDRGDVPGWVLVTLMTAGLVVGLWAVAGPRFEALFTQAMDTVVGQL